MKPIARDASCREIGTRFASVSAISVRRRAAWSAICVAEDGVNNSGSAVMARTSWNSRLRFCLYGQPVTESGGPIGLQGTGSCDCEPVRVKSYRHEAEGLLGEAE